MEVPSQSFLKIQVPSVKQNETEVNKVFKPQVLNMSLTLFLFQFCLTCYTIPNSRLLYDNHIKYNRTSVKELIVSRTIAKPTTPS